MEFQSVFEGKDLKKSFKGFDLDISSFKVPKGFATALIGENGAGKTTLLNMLAGLRLDYKGSLTYFGQYNDKDREKNPVVKNSIGYTGSNNYFLPHWTIKQVEDINALLFDSFSQETFRRWCDELAIFNTDSFEGKKEVKQLSEGNKMKLMFAGVLARDTKALIMDEPASPLDPLMRDKLCQMIREYLNEEEGERSVFFSTHNISDMEGVTDYAIIMERGKIVEKGFVEDLKEKYILIKGEKEDIEKVRGFMYSITTNPYGFEGLALATDLDKFAGMDVTREVPTLYQISVAVLAKNSRIKMN